MAEKFDAAVLGFEPEETFDPEQLGFEAEPEPVTPPPTAREVMAESQMMPPNQSASQGADWSKPFPVENTPALPTKQQSTDTGGGMFRRPNPSLVKVNPVSETWQGFGPGFTKADFIPDSESVQNVVQDVSRPVVKLPRFTVNRDDSKGVAILKSLANLGISIPEFIESPVGAVSAVTGMAIPRTVAAGFAALTGKSVVDQAKQLGSNWDDLSPAERAAAITDIGGTAAMTATMAHGATRAPRVPPNEPPGGGSGGARVRIAEQPVTPEMEALAEKARGIQRPPPLPPEAEAAAAVLPRAGAAVREIVSPPAETVSPETPIVPPPTPEVPNASQNETPATVHGNVRPLEKPAEVVPVEEGRGGVQPPAETQKGEVSLKPWQLVSDTPAEKFTQAIKDSGHGGVTNWAYDTASQITSEDIPTLEAAREKIVEEGREAIKKGVPPADMGLRAQYFSEAIRMRKAMDAATERKATTDAELAGIAREFGVQGVGAFTGKEADVAISLKEALAKQKSKPVEGNPAEPAESESTTLIDPKAAPIQELPVESITVDEASVPNFKSGADLETGVVAGEQLSGKYERLGTAPIVVWKRNDGRMVVVTGRHRLDLAKRTGEKTIPAQVVEESKGFTEKNALTLDAEANIRDGQGNTEDYAQYFKHSPELTEAEAKSRGLLSRAKGQNGFVMARSASDDLYAAWRGDKVSDAEAIAVARAAPGNAEAQAIGLKALLNGKSADLAAAMVKAGMAESGGKARALDLFGRDDAAMQAMEDMGKRAVSLQRQIREQLSAISGAAKNPEAAAKLGVNVSDPAAVQAKVAELRALLERWQDWPLHPDLVEQAKGGVAKTAPEPPKVPREQPEVPPEPPKVEPQPPKLRPGEKGTGQLLQGEDAPFNLAGEKGTDAERIAAEKAKAEKDAAEAKRIQDEQQGDLPNVGPPMGASVLGELEPGRIGGTPSSNKNEVVDAERAKRGLPPMMQPIARSWGDVWTQAMAKIDADAGYQDRLIVELIKHPRPITDVENAALLQRRVDLRNELEKSMREGAQAYDDGRLEAVQEANLRTVAWSDKLAELEQATKTGGTETGRALNARRMMMNEDYSLASMIMQKRAANGGKPLTEAQTAEVKALHDKLAATQKAFDEHVTQTAERESKLRAQAELDRIAREEAAKQPAVPSHVRILADKILKAVDGQAEAARARIKARTGQLFAGVDPTVLYDVASIGASHILHGLDNFAEWSKKMVEEFSDRVTPHLQTIWDASKKQIDDQIGQKGGKQPGEVRKAFAQRSPGDQAKATKDAISEKIKAGKNDEVTFYVQRLAKALVAGGIKGREELIDAVHSVLKEVMPDITRRETMDAISGYGDFKQLSKDEISVKLRGYKGEMQQIAKLEDMQAGQPPLKTGIERRTPTEAERGLIKAVNDAKREFQIPISDPATQLKSALDTAKARYRTAIAEYEQRLRDGNFTPKVRRELKLDAEAQRLKAENERARQAFQKALVLDRLKNRTTLEKVQDTFVKLFRGFILSGPATLAKLTAAAAIRMGLTPIEEGIGGVISKAIPQVAERAPSEGGFNVKAEAKALTDGFTKGMADSWKLLTTGHTDLEVLYGKANPMPRHFLDFIGEIHGALKAPTLRNAFARSFEKRTAHALRNGADVSDPLVQTSIAVAAFKDAKRSIFLQDNRVVSAYKRMLSGLEEKSKVTGKTPIGGKAMATAARIIFPIVKVPTNIVAETLQYATGAVTGSVRLGMALRKGVETLHPDEADLIMRELKKGSLGSAVLLAGFLLPQAIGGYYQQGEKRKKTDIKPGEVRINGVDIPNYLMHAPVVEALHLGATIRRVADSKLRKKDTENQGIGAGILAGAIGLGDEVPFFQDLERFFKIATPSQRSAYFGELGKSIMVPRLVQWLAEHTDKNAQGQMINRTPRTAVERVKTGIPGLREQVPQNKNNPVRQ